MRLASLFMASFSASILFPWGPVASADETLLVRRPTVSASAICFVYAGDLWTVGREGGVARRLTVHPGVESMPLFSPDGKWIAFTGNYDGNADVYLTPAEGGDPRRLTMHPASDTALGFTPDGTRILFRSNRASDGHGTGQLFTLPVAGGFEELLPLPLAEAGSFAPDGRRLVYAPISEAFRTWKRYRGGMTSPLWIVDLASKEIEEIPSQNCNDAEPLWLGNTIYFLSDRASTMNLFAYDVVSRSVRQLTQHDDFDVKSFGGQGDVLVYEQAGRLHQLDLKSGQTKPLSIQIGADLPETRRHLEPAPPFIRDAGLSPSGVRACFEARGDIFTVPAKKGDIRNLTRTPAVHERSPAWSPDGRWIACFSDASGEYGLELHPQDGIGLARTLRLDDPPSFYYAPRWSPDSKRIAYTDKRLNLWFIEVDGGAPVLVDTDSYDHPVRSLDLAWSPDGKWLAYTRRLPNHFRALFLYEFDRRPRDAGHRRPERRIVRLLQPRRQAALLRGEHQRRAQRRLARHVLLRAAGAQRRLRRGARRRRAVAAGAAERRGEDRGAGEAGRSREAGRCRQTGRGREGCRCHEAGRWREAGRSREARGRGAAHREDRLRRHRPAHPRPADPGAGLGQSAVRCRWQALPGRTARSGGGAQR
jgi:tricorn protease